MAPLYGWHRNSDVLYLCFPTAFINKEYLHIRSDDEEIAATNNILESRGNNSFQLHSLLSDISVSMSSIQWLCDTYN